jgi:drug/metabolite transporter (DMT)-like permease
MLVTGLNFVAVTAIVKHVGGRIPAAESAFLRFAMGLVFLLPVLVRLGGARFDRSTLILFTVRGAVHTFGVILWFFAMTNITLAEVTAMNYMNPLYVTVGAAFFLGETLHKRRLMAIAVALLGALIILRPGFRDLLPGHVAMLGAAVFFAGSYLIAGKLARLAKPTQIVAMMSITVTIGLAPFAAAVWVTPQLDELVWLFAVAGFATFGHFAMMKAFAAAPMTVTQPVTFLQLVWSVLLGALFFGEPVDGWVVLGGVLILSAVTFVTWREAVLKRRVTPVVNETKL